VVYIRHWYREKSDFTTGFEKIMSINYTKMVEKEIQRLEKLGWNELKKTEKDLIKTCNPIEISFPSELFEDIENGINPALAPIGEPYE
jgi:hypothetical protein